LQVKFLNKGTTLIVHFNGELDHHSAEYVRQKIDNEIIKSTTKNIIFDFSNLSFMDSSGIGVIMGRYKNIQKLNGKAVVININEQVRRVFELSGMMKIIPGYENVETALSKM
jgi:stage II sporulation protein AA (anti-sigma F factor antagonist)